MATLGSKRWRPPVAPTAGWHGARFLPDLRPGPGSVADGEGSGHDLAVSLRSGGQNSRAGRVGDRAAWGRERRRTDGDGRRATRAGDASRTAEGTPVATEARRRVDVRR